MLSSSKLTTTAGAGAVQAGDPAPDTIIFNPVSVHELGHV